MFAERLFDFKPAEMFERRKKENPKEKPSGLNLKFGLNRRLSLGELGCATGALETVFLTLFHSGITGQETCFLENGAKLGVILEQSTGKTVADGAGLAGNSAAAYATNDVEFAVRLGDCERLTNDELKSFKTEIFVNVTVVDGDFAGAVINTDAGYRALSAAGSVEIRFAVVHYSLPPLKCISLGLLSRVLVVGALVNAKTGEGVAADGVVGNHALDSKLHSKLGTLAHKGAVIGLLKMSDVTGVTAIELLGELVSGQHGLVGVYDDNVISAVEMGNEGSLALAAKKIGGNCCYTADGLSGGVEDLPFTLNVGCFRHIS